MRELFEKSGEKGPRSGSKTLTKEDLTSLTRDVTRELNKTFADMVKENSQRFSRKFDAKFDALSMMLREEFRELKSGPHDQIRDSVRVLLLTDVTMLIDSQELQTIWKQSVSCPYRHTSR